MVTTNTEESSEDDYEYVVIPPDGGWAWFVVAASFMGLFISDGIARYSFALVQRELELYFQESSETVAWIYSIQMGVSLLTGKALNNCLSSFHVKLIFFRRSDSCCFEQQVWLSRRHRNWKYHWFRQTVGICFCVKIYLYFVFYFWLPFRTWSWTGLHTDDCCHQFLLCQETSVGQRDSEMRFGTWYFCLCSPDSFVIRHL